MSDLGTTAFDNSEKIDILIKENFNVSSTNENTPWYLENNATFNTYVNGKDILLDEIPNSVNWSSSSFLTASELSSIYGLTSNDFYSGGGVKVDSTGVLHKFIKLKLQPIPGTNITSGSTTTYFSYYHKNSNGINLLENSFQLNHGDGSSFAYSMYSNAGIANNVSILQDSNGGNWFFNFKNGIVFIPDPTKNSTMLSNVNQNNLPYFTFVKYVGRKGIAKQISVVQNKTTITNPENNQIAVQTSDNTLHRYDTSTTSWISIGGSGGGSSGGGSTTIASLSDVSDVTYPSGAITNGYVLKWNSTTSKWEPSADEKDISLNSLNEITDVNVTTKNIGDVLKWDGSKWISAPDLQSTNSGSSSGQIGTQILNASTQYYILEQMKLNVDGGSFKNSKGEDKKLNTSPEIVIPYKENNDGVGWYKLNIFDDTNGFYPPEGANQVDIKFTAFLSFNNEFEIFNQDALLEWYFAIDNININSSRRIAHLDLVEQYAFIDLSITIDDTLFADDLENNKLIKWDADKQISIYARSLDSSQLVKLHKKQPNIEITSIGPGITNGTTNGSSGTSIIKNAQVLEKIKVFIDGAQVTNSLGQKKNLADQTTEINIPYNANDNGDGWLELDIFNNQGFKPPNNTKQVSLKYSFYTSFHNNNQISAKDAMLELLWVIDDVKINNSKKIIHLDLIEQFNILETLIYIDSSISSDDLTNNKLKTWSTDKVIKIYARSMDSDRLVKLHKKKPNIEITSIGVGAVGGGGSGNGVTVIPSSASVDLSENIFYPTADTGTGKEGDIIYDASQNLFYEASSSKTDNIGNGEIAFRPLGYSFFAKNMEGQSPNVQSTSFFFFDLTPSSITFYWKNPFQYETGITASPSQLLNETSPIVSQPSGDVGGKINFPVVNRIMMQIKNIETNQYITWGSKRSPISKYVTGLTGGYVICSKDYPIPPMNSNRNFGNILSDGGRSNSIYKMQDFAESIILFSAGNTPTNNIIKSGIASYPKRIFPVSGENDKELDPSEQGYEIKFWYENEYKKNPNSTFEDGWGMNENDFNVITLNQAKDQSGNLILDNGKINFLTVLPPTQPQEAISSIAFNNLGYVSNSNTLIEIKLKDPLKTTDTDIQYNSTINLVQIKFEYRNSATSGTDDNWNNVRKIFDKNAGLTSNNYSIANKGEQGLKVTLDNGIYMINRKVDEQYRYFYVEVNNDMLGLTNYNIEKYLSFRISYKNASTDEFGGETISNDIIFDRPNKPTISEIKMTSYDTFTITLAGFNDREDIIGDTTSISNNNMGVFLRNINFNVAYQYSDQLSQSNITTFTEIEGVENSTTTSTNTSVYINTTSFGSSTYTYTLPAGFYPNGSTNTNPITYYFSASVQNNLISNYSEVSDQKSIQITKPNSSMTITLAPQTSGSNYNNKILATFTAPSNGNRGIVSAQADNGLPKLQKYTFQSTHLKNVDSDVAVDHTNTINSSNRNADPSTQRMLTFYDSLKGSTGSVTKNLDLAVREYNEYVNYHTEVTTNISATATKPDLVTISSDTNLVISNTTSKNRVTLNWNLPDNKRGLTINNVKIRNTILTYRINIERAATTNKFIDNNSNHIDTTYETFTTRTDNSNDKTGTVDADNTKTLTSSNDGSLLWPNSTYNYTVRATNSLGYQSDAQTTKGTFATGTPDKPSSIDYFTNSRLNTLHNNVRTDFKDFQNYQYLGIKIYGRTSSSVAVQITEVDTSFPSSFPKIYSNTITHVLNKTNLQNFLTNTEVQSWSNNVPNNANQACFKVINEADNNNEYYSLGASNEYGNEHHYGGEVGLDFFNMTRQNRKDIYSDTYDDRNRGYWLQESIQYTLDIGNGINQIIYKPNKFVLQSFYNENGNDDLIEKVTPTGTTVICHNSYSTNNDYVYFDVLSSLPSISKLNSNPFINYTVNNYINGVPNIARLSNTYNKLSLTYIIKKYSALYYLDKTVNIFYHTINNANTNGTIGQVSWATFGSNTPYSYTNGKITTLRGNVGDEDDSYWQINNYEFDFTTTCSSSRADLQLTIHANNTKGHSSYLVNEGVCKFIYDKNSVDLTNELKNASEAAHSTSSASSSTQNGQIMDVPSNFNPHELSSGTTQGTNFNDTVFNQFSSNYNSKQLILFNGKFSTPKYLYDSNRTFYNALHSNKSTYGITKTFNTISNTSYSWVIYKFIRKYTGSGTQNLNWFVLSFNENSNITSTNLENGDAQIWIQTKITTDGTNYVTHTYTPNPADNAPGSLKWINYKPSGANTTQSVAATLGAGANLGANNNSSSFDETGSVGSSGINISGTTYSSKKRNLVGVINNLSKISSSGNIIYYIAVGLKNNKSLWVSKPASFDVFLPDKNISR